MWIPERDVTRISNSVLALKIILHFYNYVWASASSGTKAMHWPYESRLDKLNDRIHSMNLTKAYGKIPPQKN